MYKLGIDIGSTTVKVALLDEKDSIIESDYERHYANIRETLLSIITKITSRIPEDTVVSPMITGSGGLCIADIMKIPFSFGTSGRS